MNNDCLDERAVVAFLAGGLDEPELSSVENHLATCSTCMELTTWAAAEHAHRSRAPGDEGRRFIGTLAPGSRIDRYQILGAVGRGGMGEVYAAYHPDLDRRIALKVVRESGADTTDRRTRLLREARAIARLSHPNVITVYDAGTVDDRVYIAMEFVDGETVADWLHARPRSWREILDLFIAAGRGLAAAHAAGVLHRDFKPHNVMIGRDGSVRVTDFGLARLADEPLGSADVPLGSADVPLGSADVADPAELPLSFQTSVTQTGDIVGTPAYMAPEQFRRESLDARADQFSFCVALHEALYGRRPKLSHLHAAAAPAPTPAEAEAEADADAPAAADGDADASTASRRSGAPAWLRSVVIRGLSEDRDRRFASMDALLAAVSRGRTRLQRRTAVFGIGIALVLLSLGAWRLAAARRISCAAPTDRLAAVWPAGDGSSPRRQAVHRAFTSSGRPNAETAWQRVATAIDDYTTRWSAMYVQTCEATHVRGEQSGEVLDLRMGCLTETLDGVRALTDVLSRADGEMVSQAVAAASNLTPLNRCADIAALRAAVPAPRDEKTARTVASLRRSLREAIVLEQAGNDRAALAATRAILPQVEAAAYQPLLAETLYLIGAAEVNATPADAEIVMEKALYTAEASRDDITAAKAAISLVAITGYGQHRRRDSDRWASLAHAILDRMASPQPLLRAWLFHNQAATLNLLHDFEAARALLEQSLALKEAELGTHHPDVARTAVALTWALTELQRPAEALRMADRAAEILGKLDPESVQLAYAFHNRGDALNMLKRYQAAEESYLAALRILRSQLGPTHYVVAQPLHGIGEGKLAQGDAAGAIPYFDEALKLREGRDPDAVAVGDTQFALAQALLESGREPARARTLAASAQKTYASSDQPRKQRDVVAWLAAHAGSRNP